MPSSQHVVSSKHRRFAQNPKNWVALDKLLSKITRPMLPQYRSSSPVLEGDSGFFDGSVDSCGSQDEEEVPEDDEELSDEE